MSETSKDDKQSKVYENWHLIDAKGLVLGRLSTRIASILMGKNLATYQRNQLSNNHVVVINCKQITVTGNKKETKAYKRYSGYPGGLKEVSLESTLQKDPTYPLKHSVKGMLPKSKLGHSMLGRLHIYENEIHPHQAQKPKELKVTT